MALADVAKLIVALTLDDKLSGPLGRVESGLGRMGKGVGQVGGGLLKLGTLAGAVAVGGIGLAAKAAIDFEDAFAGIRKTVDEEELEAAGLSFESLSDSIRAMAREIPVAATDLARIGEAAGALGIKAQDIDDFTRVVAELSVTTNLTSDAAATALGQLGTILNLTGDDFRDFGDSLVALGNAGASTEDQIIEIAARFAASGRAAGLSNEEILALASATASMGIEVEAAGSSLSRVFTNVATNIGTSSKKGKAFADALGLSATEFKKAWAEDALGTFEDFLEKLNELDQFEAAALLKKVGITQRQDINAVRLMAQNIDDVNKALEVSEGATGALGEEAAEKFKTVASLLKVVRNNVDDVGITIGTELLPIIGDLTKEFADFLNTPGAQSFIKDFAKDLGGGIRSLVSELKGTDFSGVIAGMKLAAEVAKGAFDAFRALPAPIQQLAIAALVANKVSGGAIGSIAKGLGNILLGSLKTITAANVTVIGGTVTGGGVPGVAGAAGGAGGIITRFLGLASAAAFGAILGDWIGKEVFYNPTVKPTVDSETSIFDQFVEDAGLDAEELILGLDAVNQGLDDLRGDNIVDNVIRSVLARDEIAELERQATVLQELLDTAIASKNTQHLTEVDAAAIHAAFNENVSEQKTAAVTLERIRSSISELPGPVRQLALKEFTTNVNVNVDTQISVSNVVQRMLSYTTAYGSGPGGPVNLY